MKDILEGVLYMAFLIFAFSFLGMIFVIGTGGCSTAPSVRYVENEWFAYQACEAWANQGNMEVIECDFLKPRD